MKINRATFLSLLLLAGCGSQNSENLGQIIDGGSKVIDITEGMNMEWQRAEDFMESVKVIPLETSRETVLSRHLDVAVGKRSIFVCSRGNNAMFFDFNGKAMRILPRGQGPEEYNSAYKVKYLPDEDCFYLWDNSLSKIIKFDGLGKFITYYPINRLFVVDFFPVEGGFLFVQDPDQATDGTDYKVFLADSLGGVKKTWIMGTDVKGREYCENFRYMDGKIVLEFSVRNQNYTYKDGEISKHCKVTYDGMPELDCSQPQDWSEIQEKYPDTYFLARGTLENKRFMWLSMKSTKDLSASKEILYNKSTGKCLCLNTGQAEDSFISWMFCTALRGVAGYDGESFVGVVDPSSYLEFASYMAYTWNGSNYGNLIPDADLEKLRNLTADDNPVIVLFKFKSEI